MNTVIRLKFSISIGLAVLAAVPLLAVAAEPAAAELEYSVADEDLRLVQIDSDPRESFLAVTATSSGDLFVGGREALFYYPLDSKSPTGYAPRQEVYRFPDHTWIYDIVIRGPDLYVLTVSALYVLPGAVNKHEDVQARRLIWGVPLGHVHQCFHGLALGPEGDLYFAMGDPLWYYGDFNRPDHWGHWTFFSQPEGTQTPYNGVGGVFRCRPDGSNFQVVARGLRNSCGLAFDQYWNLFTNDNDHEGLPVGYVPGRLVHVVPQAYYSWPRGWMVSKTPDRADLLETMIGTLGRAVPVGQVYYHETFLPRRFRNNLIIARWGIRALTRYPLQHRGASFQVSEEHLLDGRNTARPVSVGVGRGGRVFATIAYMAHNEGSPVYPSDLVMITRKDDAAGFPFQGYNHLSADAAKLWSELSDPSWQRRTRAHQEILRRGGDVLTAAQEKLNHVNLGDPAATHLVWLAAAAENPAQDADDRLTGLGRLQKNFKSLDANLRLQLLRALTAFPQHLAASDGRLFVQALSDPSPQVQHAAVLGLFGFEGRVPEAVLSGPARSRDTYLRHAGVMLLAQQGSLERIAQLCKADDAAGRLAGALAAGFRLTLPPATERVPHGVELVEGRGNEIPFAEKTVDLRQLGPIGNYTMADFWKQAAHTAEQEQLFALLTALLKDPDEQVRLQAAHFLSVLNDARSEPQVAAVRKATQDRRLEVAPLHGINRAWIAGPFDDHGKGFQTVHPPQQGVIELSARYKQGGEVVTWRQLDTQRLFDFHKEYGPCDGQSFYAFFRLDSAAQQRINLLVGSDDGVQVWRNGREIWTNDVSRGALPLQDVISFEVEPGGNDILIRVRNRDGSCGLYAHYRSLEPAAAGLPEKLDIESLSERLKGGDGPVKLGPEFLEVDWQQSAAAGDPERGRKVFEALSCVKCHAVGTAQVAGGPSLADAGRRFTVPHLVQSILLPNKQVSPVFKATTLVTTGGQQFTGLVIGETAEKIELLLQDAKKKTIATKDIEQRQLRDLSPMPQNVIKKPEELKDILAFLLNQK